MYFHAAGSVHALPPALDVDASWADHARGHWSQKGSLYLVQCQAPEFPGHRMWRGALSAQPSACQRSDATAVVDMAKATPSVGTERVCADTMTFRNSEWHTFR